MDYFAGNTVKAARIIQAKLHQNSGKSRSMADSLININSIVNAKSRLTLIDNLLAGDITSGYVYYNSGEYQTKDMEKQ